MSPTKFTFAVVFTAVTTLPLVAQAVEGKFFDQTGADCCCCPVCDHVCKLSVEADEKERTCYEIETKVICIPRVVFPWQTAKHAQRKSCTACDGRGCQTCVHNGARLRKVKVFKAKKYTCPSCKYTWSPEKKDCCSGCAGTCCDQAICDQAICDEFIGDPLVAPSLPSAPTPPQLDESNNAAYQPFRMTDESLGGLIESAARSSSILRTR